MHLVKWQKSLYLRKPWFQPLILFLPKEIPAIPLSEQASHGTAGKEGAARFCMRSSY